MSFVDSVTHKHLLNYKNDNGQETFLHDCAHLLMLQVDYESIEKNVLNFDSLFSYCIFVCQKLVIEFI